MTSLFTPAVLIPITALLAFGLVPSSVANGSARRISQVSEKLLMLLIAIAAAATAACLMRSFDSTLLANFVDPASTNMLADGWLRLDGISTSMLLLVSVVGWVVCRYSQRYLDGEANQGRFFRWIGFTVGSVALMVTSGNLVLLIAAWGMIHLGLHRLLTHYDDLPGARAAATAKFAISRLGDVALVGSAFLLYQIFGTLQLTELFASVNADGFVTDAKFHVACGLLAFAAVTKSVQFPFHTWLPRTLQTPTPVSAFMHAGIVNAGGYLLIRLSPLVSQSTWVLAAVALLGAITACLAATIMMTQSSVKNALAYSTIAQMGFMMLQCGMGAFTAAMLHIFAHSLYKAYAFLNSGDVLSQPSSVMLSTDGTNSQAGSSLSVRWLDFGLAALLVTLFYSVALAALRLDVMTKPGGLVLGFVLCAALSYWLAQVMAGGCQRTFARSLGIAGGLCFVYVISFQIVDAITAGSFLPSNALAAAVSGPVWLPAALTLATTLGFASLLWVMMRIAKAGQSPVMRSLYVHASNGFYFDAAYRRFFGNFATS